MPINIHIQFQANRRFFEQLEFFRRQLQDFAEYIKISSTAYSDSPGRLHRELLQPGIKTGF